MKKLVLTFGLCSLLVTAPSCQKEDIQPQDQTEQTLEKDCCPGENGTDPSNPGGKG